MSIVWNDYIINLLFFIILREKKCNVWHFYECDRYKLPIITLLSLLDTKENELYERGEKRAAAATQQQYNKCKASSAKKRRRRWA